MKRQGRQEAPRKERIGLAWFFPWRFLAPLALQFCQMSNVAIQVQDVTKIFGGRTVLDAIRLDVFEGETLVILGGSGSGKSTLLRLMIGNVRPESGDVIGLGKSLRKMSAGETDDYRKSVGVLFQSGALFNSMTVAENVALPLREHTDLPEETIQIMVKIKL